MRIKILAFISILTFCLLFGSLEVNAQGSRQSKGWLSSIFKKKSGKKGKKRSVRAKKVKATKRVRTVYYHQLFDNNNLYSNKLTA